VEKLELGHVPFVPFDVNFWHRFLKLFFKVREERLAFCTYNFFISIGLGEKVMLPYQKVVSSGQQKDKKDN